MSRLRNSNGPSRRPLDTSDCGSESASADSHRACAALSATRQMTRPQERPTVRRRGELRNGHACGTHSSSARANETRDVQESDAWAAHGSRREMPPSTSSVWPVMNSLASKARDTIDWDWRRRPDLNRGWRSCNLSPTELKFRWLRAPKPQEIPAKLTSSAT